MSKSMTYINNEQPETVAAIVYHTVDGKMIPHSVFTAEWVDRSKLGKGYPPSGYFVHVYDFDWCKRNEQLYQHNSGSGGNFYLGRMAFPKSTPRCAVWWDPHLVQPHNDRSPASEIGVAHIRRIGYDILDKPLVLFDGSQNPFDHALESEVEYCSKCDDHLPTDDLCEHIWWCEKCGEYSIPGSRCKHRRTR